MCRSTPNSVPVAAIVALATFSASPAGAQQDARWTLVPDVVYAEPADAPLTSITGIAGRASGEAFVLDRIDSGILHFDGRGAYTGRVGRAGEGPGEFRSRSSMGTVGDSLWVIDLGLSRITIFGPEPDKPRTFTPPRLPRTRVAPLAVLAGARTLVQAGERLDDMTVTVVDSDSSVVRTIAIDWGKRNLIVTVGPLERVLTNPYTFGSVVGIAADSRHFALATQPKPTSPTQGNYEVFALDAAGSTVWTARVPHRPDPLPATEVNAWVEDMNTQSAEAGGISRRALLGAVRDSLGDVRFRAPIVTRGGSMTQSVLVERDAARVWVRRGPDEWDVVGRGGREAVVRAPDGVTLMAIAGDYAWGVETDEYDVPRIRRFRVQRN